MNISDELVDKMITIIALGLNKESESRIPEEKFTAYADPVNNYITISSEVEVSSSPTEIHKIKRLLKNVFEITDEDNVAVSVSTTQENKLTITVEENTEDGTLKVPV
jgi:type III secretory pathway lipoprotein EscJ